MKTLPALLTSRILLLFLLFGLTSVQAFRIPPSLINPLTLWNDGEAKKTIVEFVTRTTNPVDPRFIAKEDRIAVIDLDGTLICEKPDYFQIIMARYRLSEMIRINPRLAHSQPWKAQAEGDNDYLAHHLASVLIQAFQGMEQNEYMDYARRFLRTQKHPRFDRPYADLMFAPIVELIHYLHERGFRVFIVSGSETGFLRAVAEGLQCIPPEQMLGTNIALEFYIENDKPRFRRGDHFLKPENWDAGKAENIHNAIGKPPVFAIGNSISDIDMLLYTNLGSRHNLVMILKHDDAVREYAYTDEDILKKATEYRWPVISMREDFKEIFDPSK